MPSLVLGDLPVVFVIPIVVVPCCVCTVVEFVAMFWIPLLGGINGAEV